MIVYKHDLSASDRLTQLDRTDKIVQYPSLNRVLARRMPWLISFVWIYSNCEEHKASDNDNDWTHDLPIRRPALYVLRYSGDLIGFVLKWSLWLFTMNRYILAEKRNSVYLTLLYK